MKKPTYTLRAIPAGKAGTLATLKIMRALARKYKCAPGVRMLTQKLTKNLSNKKYSAEANAVFMFVRDKIRYVKDIRGVETVQTPVQTVKTGSGDCDDKSLLIAAMLESIGHPTRFVAVGFIPGTFSHVFTQTKIGRKWVTLETTMQYPMGKNPPGITSKMMMSN